jgi:sugar O-acyltransferase (sialic acid O-acetyltransferase NeuD family)
MTDIVLIGGGGHCKSCIQVVETNSVYKIVGVLDMPETVGNKILDYKVIGTDADIGTFDLSTTEYLVTVGQLKSAALRRKLYEQVLGRGATLATIIAKSAVVSRHATVGQGTIVMHYTLVNSDVVVGTNCIINNFANVEHDAEIGDHCHISTGAMINGNVKIGEQVFVGSGSVISNGLSVCACTVIGAGSVVLKDIVIPGIYSGNPATYIKPIC